MKVTKYPQSHLIIQGESTKLIIDPGSLTFSNNFGLNDFKGADGYLITHQHADHMDPTHIKEVTQGQKVYGNPDVVTKLKELEVEATEVHNREKFSIGEFEITPVDLPHCKMQDGTDGPPNTGFLINGILFHPGDGDKSPSGVTSQNLALPIAGPTITFDGALQFAKDVEAQVVIPIHYDYFKADPEEFKKLAEPLGIEVRPLKNGEETDI